MRFVRDFVANAVVGGLLVLVPVYIAVLLLGKAMQTGASAVKPLADLLPSWLPAQHVLSLLLVLLVCFAIGLLVRTSTGSAVREQLDRSVFGRLPGYETLRSLSRQVAGRADEAGWKPVIVEIEDALVPAFVVEKLDDGRYTVFVPSVPTPFAGAIYVMSPERVHKVDVPVGQAVRAISQWGVGTKGLIEKMAPRDAA
jgi:uncharacterized membrane protein